MGPQTGLAGLGLGGEASGLVESDLGNWSHGKDRRGGRREHPFSKEVSLETRVLLGTGLRGREESVQEPLTGLPW